MQGRISKLAIDALEVGILWDNKLPGFGVRARTRGKVYVLKFRSGGKQRWHTIGRHGSPWTPEEARREAKRLLGELGASGRAPGQPRGGATVAEGVEAFIDAHCRHLRTGNEITWLLRKHVVGKWGDRRLTSIGQGDVVQLLRDVLRRRPHETRSHRKSSANGTREVLPLGDR